MVCTLQLLISYIRGYHIYGGGGGGGYGAYFLIFVKVYNLFCIPENVMTKLHVQNRKVGNLAGYDMAD